MINLSLMILKFHIHLLMNIDPEVRIQFKTQGERKSIFVPSDEPNGIALTRVWSTKRRCDCRREQGVIISRGVRYLHPPSRQTGRHNFSLSAVLCAVPTRRWTRWFRLSRGILPGKGRTVRFAAAKKCYARLRPGKTRIMVQWSIWERQKEIPKEREEEGHLKRLIEDAFDFEGQILVYSKCPGRSNRPD